MVTPCWCSSDLYLTSWSQSAKVVMLALWVCPLVFFKWRGEGCQFHKKKKLHAGVPKICSKEGIWSNWTSYTASDKNQGRQVGSAGSLYSTHKQTSPWLPRNLHRPTWVLKASGKRCVAPQGGEGPGSEQQGEGPTGSRKWLRAWGKPLSLQVDDHDQNWRRRSHSSRGLSNRFKIHSWSLITLRCKCF